MWSYGWFLFSAFLPWFLKCLFRELLLHAASILYSCCHNNRFLFTVTSNNSPGDVFYSIIMCNIGAFDVVIHWVKWLESHQCKIQYIKYIYIYTINKSFKAVDWWNRDWRSYRAKHILYVTQDALSHHCTTTRELSDSAAAESPEGRIHRDSRGSCHVTEAVFCQICFHSYP